MRLLELSLEHFRTYQSCSVDLRGADVHVLLGRNGIGKTNFLEAISVLSLTRSCRGSDEEDLRSWEKEHYLVRGTAENDDEKEMKLEVVSAATPRRARACFINDVRTPAAAYAGTLPTVSFLPEDLGLFHGAPAERRRFLDQLLSQVSPEYLQSLSLYQQTLRQRGALLKRLKAGGDVRELDPWDRQLAAAGAVLTVMRLELLQTINLALAAELSRLGETWQEPHLLYERETGATDRAMLEIDLLQRILDRRARDVEVQMTTVGPHREDWQLIGADRPVPSWASRGQSRVALIALLLLQVTYLEMRRGERPLVLLDDVFSELDAEHQRALLASLQGHQMFLTGTALPPDLPAAIAVWQATEGCLTRA